MIEAIYRYTDEAGDLLYEVIRKSGKKFRQRYPDGSGGWTWRKHPHQVLYHVREVLENPIVFVVEGEKDVQTMRDFGFVATTNAGGAKAPWLPEFTEALRGHEVILIPDNDAPGRERVLRIARALSGNVAKLVILTLDDPGVKDVSDWFAARAFRNRAHRDARWQGSLSMKIENPNVEKLSETWATFERCSPRALRDDHADADFGTTG